TSSLVRCGSSRRSIRRDPLAGRWIGAMSGCFLAVAREDSMRAAGRALGLSQPTIARRLAAFADLDGACSRDDPKGRLTRRRQFVPDSALEGTGLGPSVPLLLGW